ncbi:MAG: dihydropteroate synthase [Bacteroidaceae bacterium]|nr:dihydropteroate synthase [Bacteroidaceae bacterium]
MQRTIPYTLNIGGQLLSLERPLVMGILNATVESFYEVSQMHTASAVAERTLAMLREGASIIDVGGCSTKPGLAPVSEEEEMRRLGMALAVVRKVAPEAVLSVDTFRASVAERCVKDFGVQVINDVSGGADERMFDVVAGLQVPYVLTCGKAPGATLMCDLAERIGRLHLMGVNDVVVDPGFGFGKTLDDNYRLMAHLEELHLLECPLLVGVSRKSMIYKFLGVTPDEALNGTTVLHTIALMKGAHILRVHDVRAAVEAVAITEKLKNSSESSDSSDFSEFSESSEKTHSSQLITHSS